MDDPIIQGICNCFSPAVLNSKVSVLYITEKLNKVTITVDKDFIHMKSSREDFLVKLLYKMSRRWIIR